jgi:hypothetical protein
MPKTANYGVPYTEYFEGYRESWSNDGTAEAVRILECDWLARGQFIKAMLGGVTEGINRIPPDVHPDYTLKSLGAGGGGGLVATNVELIAGIGVPNDDGPGGMISYDRARFAVTYKAVPYNITGGTQKNELEADRYIIRKTNYAIESLTIPGQGLKFEDTSAKINEQLSILMPTQEITYTWVMAPHVPYDAISQCIGKVNASTFDNRYEYDTLLMVAPEIEPYWHPAQEVIVWNITYKWLYRATGWNYFYRKDKNAFYKAVGVASGQTPYQTADFKILFE